MGCPHTELVLQWRNQFYSLADIIRCWEWVCEGVVLWPLTPGVSVPMPRGLVPLSLLVQTDPIPAGGAWVHMILQHCNTDLNKIYPREKSQSSLFLIVSVPALVWQESLSPGQEGKAQGHPEQCWGCSVRCPAVGPQSERNMDLF